MLADTPGAHGLAEDGARPGRYLGLETELLAVQEAKALHPLIEEKYFVGAMLDAADGHLDPYGTTHAYAKSARIGGAEIYLQDPRRRAEAARRRHLGRRHRPGHHPRRARRQLRRPVGARGRPHGRPRAAGARHGAHVPRHRGHAGGRRLQQGARQGGAARDRLQVARSTCARSAAAWCSAPTSRPACRGRRRRRPGTSGSELLPPDLDRIAPLLEIGFQHFPALGQGRHQDRHQRPLHLLAGRQSAGRAGAGPEELLGRLRRHGRLQPGRRRRPGAVAAGWSTAIRASTSGRMDVARFGDWATRSYTNEKVRENYARRFRIRFPNEELPAARPQQTTALYDVMIAAGRGDGRQLGPGDAALVRAEGRRAEGHLLLPPLERLPAREGRVPGRAQRGRRHRDRELRQVRVHRARAPRPSSRT